MMVPANHDEDAGMCRIMWKQRMLSDLQGELCTGVQGSDGSEYPIILHLISPR